MNNQLIIPLFTLMLSSMVFTGCNTAYKATATPRQVNNILCGEEWLLFPDQPHPFFEELKNSGSKSAPAIPLPKKYLEYRVSPDTLKAFFSFLRIQKNGGIILPVNGRCEPFSLKISGAMPVALQDKFPDLVSLQGVGVNNKSADLRLDWDGKQMKGQISINGSIFYLTPLQGNKEVVYIVYKREDSGEIKQPFEATPPTINQKVYYDR